MAATLTMMGPAFIDCHVERMRDVMEQTYAQKVLGALRDDGHESLSLRGLNDLSRAEFRQILRVAAKYGEWLDAVKNKAKEVLGAEAGFILKSLE